MNHYEIVKEVIDEWDPKKLLHHAPEDEYHPEIRRIVERLPNTKSVEQLAIVIHKVFVQMFSEDDIFSLDNCYPIALSIWNKLNQTKQLG